MARPAGAGAGAGVTCLKGLAIPGSPAGISQVFPHPTPPSRYLLDPASLLFLAALQSGEASLFEVNIRYIGGLLSAFYLTGEEVSWPLETPGPFRCEKTLENIQSHSLISPMRKQGFKGICLGLSTQPPQGHLLTLPPLLSEAFHSAAQVSPRWLPQLVVNSLRTTTSLFTPSTKLLAQHPAGSRLSWGL